jgi:adenylate cyclase
MIQIRRSSIRTALTVFFVVLGAVWGGFLGARHVAALGSELDRLENLSLDWRYALRGVRAAPRGVVIAAIDDETIAQAGSFPLPRGVLAQIVRGLAAYNPQAVAIDILLLDPGPPDADRELVDALRSAKAVIGAVALFDPNERIRNGETALRSDGQDLLPRPTQVIWPQQQFRSISRSGLTNMSTDHSGVPRYAPMLFDVDGAIVPSLALATVAVALNTDPVLGRDDLKLGARAVGTDMGYHLALGFYGPTGSIKTFSAIRAANGKLDPDDVSGQVVVLGSTAPGIGDSFATPFDRVTPGAEIHATAISNLLAGDALTRNVLTRRIDASLAVALPITILSLLAIRRLSIALALTTLAFGLWIVTTYVAFLQGYWLSMIVPVCAAGPVALAYGITRLWVEQSVARWLASEGDALRRFHSPLLVELLIKNPQFLAAPVEQRAAIVFVDLSGFSGVTEMIGPAWTRDLLVALHELIEKATTSQQGFVADYMGDGAMIVFGLPTPRTDDACRALRAVVRLHESLSDWLARLPPVARDRLASRVGGHFGPVILSRLGTASHQHIAATGDAVNVASRLLEVAKDRRSPIVVSEDLYRAAMELMDAPPQHFNDTAVEVSIRGRAYPILVRSWERSREQKSAGRGANRDEQE